MILQVSDSFTFAMDQTITTMKSLKCLIAFVVILLSHRCDAVEGCLVNGNELFTAPPQSVIDISVFSNLHVFGGTSQAANNCISGTTAGTCYVCDGGRRVFAVVDVGGLLYTVTCVPGGFVLPVTAAKSGTYYSNYLLQCNLDDYSLPLVVTTGILGLFVVRKRNKSKTTRPQVH